MLSYLAEYEHLFGPLRLFRYLTFRSAGAAGTALVIGFLVAPPLIARLRALKAGQQFRASSEVGRLAELHSAKAGTPAMGGLIICIAVTLSTMLWARPNVYILTALYVFLSLTALGFADDYLKVMKKHSGGMQGRYKLVFQGLIAVAALAMLHVDSGAATLIRELWLPFLKEPVVAQMPYWALIPFFFLVLAGSSNAINLTDGVDGLAVGCTITVALVYGIMSYAVGHALIADYLFLRFIPGGGELAVLCASLVSGCMAFLWYNSHPAEVFMGDTGSLAIGGLVGVVALLVLQPVTLVIVGGIFVIEASSVILQVGSYKLRGKRIFLMSPLHHHFELKGLPESKVVIRFWILSLFFALAGLATLKLR